MPSSVEELEALACQRAISFAIEIGLQDVVFEGDSRTIYSHLTSDAPCMAPFGHLIDDSRILASTLRNASFAHVKRDGAKLAKDLYEPQIWLEDIHSDVTNLVILDRNFLPY